MKNNKLSTFTILAIGFLALTSAGANPVLQKIHDAYPTISMSTIRLISTLPAFISAGFTIILGMIVGNKVKFRTIMIVGTILYIIGGTMPAYYNGTITQILIGRIIIGLGIGCYGCRNALVIRSYEEPKRTQILGWVVMCGNLGLIFFQFVNGALADLKWQYAFMTYGLAFILLILSTLFLKEPDSIPVVQNTTETTVEKKTIEPRVWLYALTMILSTMILYPLLSGMSTFIAFKKLGAATIAGTVLSFYTVGGALSGTFYGNISKALGRFIILFFGISVAVGQALVLYVNSIPVIMLGAVLCGLGFFGILITMSSFTGKVSNKKSVTIASNIIVASMQVGAFVSTYWITFMGKSLGSIFGTEIAATYGFAIIAFAVFGILTVIKDPRPKEKITN